MQLKTYGNETSFDEDCFKYAHGDKPAGDRLTDEMKVSGITMADIADGSRRHEKTLQPRPEYERVTQEEWHYSGQILTNDAQKISEEENISFKAAFEKALLRNPKVAACYEHHIRLVPSAEEMKALKNHQRAFEATLKLDRITKAKMHSEHLDYSRALKKALMENPALATWCLKISENR
jgi:hypothetical protein